jgi:hypothetical protein
MDIEPLPVKARQSCIACKKGCARKWYLQYRMGVVLRGLQIKEAAELGTIYHKFQLEGPKNKAVVKAWILEKQKALMDRVDRGEDMDGSIVQLANMLTSLYQKAEAMAEIMWERFPSPDYLQTVGKEIQWECATSYGIPLSGTLDKIVADSRYGCHWVRDHKSTGRSLESIFGGVGWSLQARVYRILAIDWLEVTYGKGVPVVMGFILDGIMKPGIKLCKKDTKAAQETGVTPEAAYLKRVKEWYAEKPEDAIRSKGLIYREPVWSAELCNAVKDLADLSQLPTDDPALFDRDVTRTSCFEYEKQCIYHDLCETDPKQWGNLFDTKYTFSKREPKDEA